MSKPKKKLNGFGYRSAASFIKLDHGLLNTEAWLTLSPDATKVLLDLWRRHNGINNGSIGYAFNAAHECLCRAYGKPVHRRRATAALQEIQDKGFVEVMRDSSFNIKNRQSREWRLTAERANDNPPTRDFKHWKIQNTGAEREPDRCREGTCRPSNKPSKGPDRCREGTCEAPSRPAHRCREGTTSNIPARGESVVVTDPTYKATVTTWNTLAIYYALVIASARASKKTRTA